LKKNGSVCRGENFGDIPTTFKFTYLNTGEPENNLELQVGSNKITLNIPIDTNETIMWDSKLGVVYGDYGTNNTLKPYSGNGCTTLPISDVNITISPSDATLKYNYWYY
jgi:hypothetical protein